MLRKGTDPKWNKWLEGNILEIHYNELIDAIEGVVHTSESGRLNVRFQNVHRDQLPPLNSKARVQVDLNNLTARAIVY